MSKILENKLIIKVSNLEFILLIRKFGWTIIILKPKKIKIKIQVFLTFLSIISSKKTSLVT